MNPQGAFLVFVGALVVVQVVGGKALVRLNLFAPSDGIVLHGTPLVPGTYLDPTNPGGLFNVPPPQVAPEPAQPNSLGAHDPILGPLGLTAPTPTRGRVGS